MPTAASRAGARTSATAIPATICSRRSTTTPTRYPARSASPRSSRLPQTIVARQAFVSDLVARLIDGSKVCKPYPLLPDHLAVLLSGDGRLRGHHLQQDRVCRGRARGGHRPQSALQVHGLRPGPTSSRIWPMPSTRPTPATSATVRSISTSTRSTASRKPRTRSRRSARSRRTSPRREAWGGGSIIPGLSWLVPGVQRSVCSVDFGGAGTGQRAIQQAHLQLACGARCAVDRGDKPGQAPR